MADVKFRPLGDRILVKPDTAPEMQGALYLPSQAQARVKPQRGTVAAAGPGRMLKNGSVHPLAVAVGDTVLFGKFAGDEIEIEGEKYLIMSEDVILAVVEA